MADQTAATDNWPSSRSAAMPRNLTAAETSVRLGVTTGTLANWRCAGAGPDYLKIGSRIMYPLDRIEEYERHCLVTVLH